jgi:VWFA-related protein
MSESRMPVIQSVRSLCFGLAVSLSFSCCAAFAQTPVAASAPSSPTAAATQAAPPAGQTADDNGNFTLKSTVNEVNLIFTVTDKHGHFINNLEPKDFALLDDQKPPAQLYSFTQQTNLPLRVGLLIDASTSIRLRFKSEQQDATEFLLEVLRPQTDRAFVMGFNAKPYITQDYTNDPDKLEAGVNKLEPAGGTALYDAIYTACRDKLLSAAPAQTTIRKALVVISDGDDNQSRAYLDDAIKMCQRAETIVYTISTNTGPTRDRGDDTLIKISLATGGTTFFPKRIEDMAVNFKQVQAELRSQYALAYKPSDFKMDGAFRTIYLEALDRHYTVRARKGYFAPK